MFSTFSIVLNKLHGSQHFIKKNNFVPGGGGKATQRKPVSKKTKKTKKFVVNDFVQLSANLRGLSFLRQVVLM